MEQDKKIDLLDDVLDAVVGGAGSATGYAPGARVRITYSEGNCPQCGAHLPDTLGTVVNCTANSRGACQCEVQFDCCGYTRNYVSGMLQKV